jgi:hypothetical protein
MGQKPCRGIRLHETVKFLRFGLLSCLGTIFVGPVLAQQQISDLVERAQNAVVTVLTGSKQDLNRVLVSSSGQMGYW